MKTITKLTLDNLSNQAMLSERGRKNLNYHDELSDPLQRLLNAMEPGTYIQPHKHEGPDKRELFIILRGKALVITFKENGVIDEHILLSSSSEDYGIEIPARTWHTVIVLKENTVLFEVKDGPYEKISDKNFAPWAPKEGDVDCTEYNNLLLKKLGYLTRNMQ